MAQKHNHQQRAFINLSTLDMYNDIHGQFAGLEEKAEQLVATLSCPDADAVSASEQETDLVADRLSQLALRMQDLSRHILAQLAGSQSRKRLMSSATTASAGISETAPAEAATTPAATSTAAAAAKIPAVAPPNASSTTEPATSADLLHRSPSFQSTNILCGSVTTSETPSFSDRGRSLSTSTTHSLLATTAPENVSVFRHVHRNSVLSSFESRRSASSDVAAERVSASSVATVVTTAAAAALTCTTTANSTVVLTTSATTAATAAAPGALSGAMRARSPAAPSAAASSAASTIAVTGYAGTSEQAPEDFQGRRRRAESAAASLPVSSNSNSSGNSNLSLRISVNGDDGQQQPSLAAKGDAVSPFAGNIVPANSSSVGNRPQSPSVLPALQQQQATATETPRSTFRRKSLLQLQRMSLQALRARLTPLSWLEGTADFSTLLDAFTFNGIGGSPSASTSAPPAFLLDGAAAAAAAASSPSSSSSSSSLQQSVMKLVFDRPSVVLRPDESIHHHSHARLRTSLLDRQRRRCPSCLTALSDSKFFSSKVRFCEYTQKLYCKTCQGALTRAILPWRMLHEWNFEEYAVCDQAREFLEVVWDVPVICVSAINPQLFEMVPALAHLRRLRLQLCQLRDQFGPEHVPSTLLLAGLGKHTYMAIDTEFFSLEDLVAMYRNPQVLLGEVEQTIRMLVERMQY